MQSRQQGFTLVELIVVIVVLAILAISALPRFIDLRENAEDAAIDGLVGAMNSAMLVNYAGCVASNHVIGPNCVLVNSCDDVQSILVGGVPSGYSVSTTAISLPHGTTATCQVSHSVHGETRNYTGVRAGN